MKIQSVDIGKLSMDPKNAREHSDGNVSAIKGSLTAFGQQKPIVISKDMVVIAGNGTLVAAKALGWKKIKCITSDLESIDQTAFALADNRTAELASWNDEILGNTLQALREDGFVIEDIGFDPDDFDIGESDDQGEPSKKGPMICSVCGQPFAKNR